VALRIDPNVSHLYRATFLFGIACGITIALSSLHLDALGFTKQEIGTLAAWFASGIVGMSIPAGALIRRFSARTTLLVFMLGYAICVAVFPYLRGYAPIAICRIGDGACAAGIWVSSETILLSRADAKHKAHLTSLYAIWLSSGYIVGPLLAKGVTAVLPMHSAFLLAGAVAVASTLYIWLRFADDGLGREQAAPAREGALHPESSALAEKPTSPWRILWRIKNSCFGTFCYGYFQASVVIFLPLYLIEAKDIPLERTIILPGLFCLGMLLSSNAAGRLADRIGHLLMMRMLSVGGTIMIFAFVFLDSYLLMCAAVVLAGATLAAMSPISLALQGVVTAQKDYSRSNAIYNAFYAIGMLAGPPVSSILFDNHSGRAMLYHLAALWSAFIVFTLIFMYDDPAARRRDPALRTQT